MKIARLIEDAELERLQRAYEDACKLANAALVEREEAARVYAEKSDAHCPLYMAAEEARSEMMRYVHAAVPSGLRSPSGLIEQMRAAFVGYRGHGI